MKPLTRFIYYACVLRAQYRAALPPRQLAPWGRADVESQQPRVDLFLELSAFLNNMVSPHHIENIKSKKMFETPSVSRIIGFYFGVSAPDFKYCVSRSEMEMAIL